MIPFLAVGDLPSLAAVNKAARKLARNSLNTRLNATMFNGDYEDYNGENRRQKQEIIVFDNEDAIPACYRRGNPARDFRDLQYCCTALEEMDGKWTLKIKDRTFDFPKDRLPPTNTRIHHCSLVKSRAVLIASVKKSSNPDSSEDEELYSDDDEPSRDLWQ